MNVGLYINSVLSCCLVFALSGCDSVQKYNCKFKEAHTKPYTPTNIYQPAPIPGDVVRVIALPVVINPALAITPPNEVDMIFQSTLQKQRLFEVVGITRNDLTLYYDSENKFDIGLYPEDFFQRIGSDYQAQAVMIFEITTWEPYKPMCIGIRERLVRAEDPNITLWACDEHFDAANRSVMAAISNYSDLEHYGPYPLGASGAVLRSPTQFFEYVCNAVLRTIYK